MFVDGDNADEMEKALKKLSDKENRSPEKDYLIGLAFFNGIGVELEKAKEEYLKAIEIDEKIDIQLKSADSAYSLSVDMLGLGDIYMKHGKYEEANRLYERATILRKQILDGEDTDDHRNKYAEAVLSMGTSMLLCGNSEEANFLLNTAKDILLNLAETNGTIQAQYAYSVALNRCAKACEEKDDFQNALNYYTDSLNRRKKILSHIRTCEAVYEYARTQFLRANSYQTIYDNATAKREYEDVVGSLKTILSRDRNGSIHRLQAEAAFGRFKLDTFSGKQYLKYAIDVWKWLSEKQIENHKFQKEYELCQRIYQQCYPE